MATRSRQLSEGGLRTFKNMVIGGDFTVNPWQRGSSFAAIAFGDYCADRWIWSGFGSTGVVTISQVEDAPTTSSSRHCLQIDVTTADTSIASNHLLVLQHRIEGTSIAHLHAGTANAKTVTLSFWHKHTKTGTYCIGFRSGPGQRSYVAEYTQSVTDTWEKAEISLTMETGGGTSQWPLDNTEGLRLSFVMAAGTDYNITADTWSVGSDFSTSNQVNAADSASNFMRIADVQLELGSVATEFENRDVGTELVLCQRYYQRWEASAVGDRFATGFGPNTTAINTVQPHIVTMRAEPSLTYDALASWTLTDGAANKTPTAWTVSPSNGSVSRHDFTVSGSVAYRPYQLRAASASGWYALDADL